MKDKSLKRAFMVLVEGNTFSTFDLPNKHLMTGPKRNSEVCVSPHRDPNCSRRGKQNMLFPLGPVFKCFVIPPNSNKEKLRKISFLHAD